MKELNLEHRPPLSRGFKNIPFKAYKYIRSWSFLLHYNNKSDHTSNLYDGFTKPDDISND